jgi:hypothetical protein
MIRTSSRKLETSIIKFSQRAVKVGNGKAVGKAPIEHSGEREQDTETRLPVIKEKDGL